MDVLSFWVALKLPPISGFSLDTINFGFCSILEVSVAILDPFFEE